MPPDQDMPDREMPQYLCHKRVWALKINNVVKHGDPDPSPDGAAPVIHGAYLYPEDAGYGPISVDVDWCSKHAPVAGGYYVVYEDGYASFSPAKALESGYSLIAH